MCVYVRAGGVHATYMHDACKYLCFVKVLQYIVTAK